jgi:hypothetical protein
MCLLESDTLWGFPNEAKTHLELNLRSLHVMPSLLPPKDYFIDPVITLHLVYHRLIPQVRPLLETRFFLTPF